MPAYQVKLYSITVEPHLEEQEPFKYPRCLKLMLSLVYFLATKYVIFNLSKNTYVLCMDVYLCVLLLIYCYVTKEKSTSPS